MASIAGQMRVCVDTEAGFGTAVSNFYGLSFSPSGSGKSIGVNLLDNMYFSLAFDYMKKEVYPKFKKKAIQKLENDGIERALQAWTPKASNATLSGLYSASETAYLVGVGNVNLSVDEVADAVVGKADLFDILLECYNNGDFPAQLKRSDNNPLDIDGIPVNLYAYGDKSKLINGDNIEFAFQNLLKTGYGRRFVFSDDKTVEVEERSPADVVKEMRATEQIKKDRLPDRERIRNLISAKKMNSVLTLTDEAMLFYAQVQCEGENFVKTNKGLAEAVQSDMLNRVFKLVKLASIYAFFEEKDKVEIEHMQQAKEIIDESSRVLTEITKLKPLHHRLLERMLEESNPCTNQHFLSYPFIPSGWTKKIEEVIKLTKELSSEKNYLWKEVSRKGVVYYSVTKQDEKTEEILKEVDQAEEIEAEKLNDEQEDLLRLLYD
jgi:ribosomal protein L9